MKLLACFAAGLLLTAGVLGALHGDWAGVALSVLFLAGLPTLYRAAKFDRW